MSILDDTPPEVRDLGFCWGALGLTWIWGIGNRVWIALAAPVLFCLLSYIASSVAAEGFYLGGPLSILFAIYLGVTGHARAWRSRRFKDLKNFRAAMEVWSTVGILAFVLKLLAFIFFAYIYLGGLANPR